jgi:hypothetical protein
MGASISNGQLGIHQLSSRNQGSSIYFPLHSIMWIFHGGGGHLQATGATGNGGAYDARIHIP